MKIVALFAFLSSLPVVAVAQDGRTKKAVADAEVERDAGRPEDAAILLRDALRSAERVADKNLRRKSVQTVRKALNKVDPLDAQRRKALQGAAKAIVPLAQAYSRSKWHETSVALLEAASQLDAAVVRRPLEKARQAVAGDAIQAWFGKRSRLVGDQSWTVRDGVVTSPTVFGERIVAIRSSNEVRGDFELLVDVKMANQAVAGIVFGVERKDGLARFYEFELVHDAPRSLFRMLRLDEHLEGDVILEQAVAFSRAERAGWMTVSVTVEGNQVRATAGVLPPITVEVARTTTGSIGLLAGTVGEGKGKVRFRSLRLTQ